MQVSGAWWTVIYTGVLSIGLGYTLPGIGQKVAPPADAAILLSLEAVFAAIAGWLFLDERLTAVQLSGCILMLGGMLLARCRNYSTSGQIRRKTLSNRTRINPDRTDKFSIPGPRKLIE